MGANGARPAAARHDDRSGGARATGVRRHRERHSWATSRIGGGFFGLLEPILHRENAGRRDRRGRRSEGSRGPGPVRDRGPCRVHLFSARGTAHILARRPTGSAAVGRRGRDFIVAPWIERPRIRGATQRRGVDCGLERSGDRFAPVDRQSRADFPWRSALHRFGRRRVAAFRRGATALCGSRGGNVFADERQLHIQIRAGRSNYALRIDAGHERIFVLPEAGQ